MTLKLPHLPNDWSKFYKRAQFGNRKGFFLKKYEKELHNFDRLVAMIEIEINNAIQQRLLYCYYNWLL